MIVNRDLGLLNKRFEPLVRQFFHIVQDELRIDARPIETLRTLDRQKVLESEGASKVKIGKHNFGYAVDFGVFIHGDYQRDDRSGLYLKCGFIGMALGMRWGGNFDMDNNIAEGNESDLGHLEDRRVRLADLIAGLG